MKVGNKQLTKKEQKTILSETITGGLNGSCGFMGGSFVNGKHTGGSAILRSDGKYHTESLDELKKQGIFPL